MVLSPHKARAMVLAYGTGIAVPIVFGILWPSVPPPFRDPPSLVSLLFIALIARFRGIGPAVLATFTFVAVLKFRVYPLLGLGRSDSFVVVVIGLFVIVSLAIASLSRQKSAKVLEVEERYRSLVELAPDPLFVTESTGIILFVNPSFARLVGARRAADLVGMNVHIFADGDANPPDESALQMDISGEPWTTAKWRSLDGSSLTVQTAVVPVRQDGETVLQGFVRDLTARQRAAEKVEDQRIRLQALFDTAVDAILFSDDSGYYIDANDAATTLLGYSREEILGRKIGSFTPPENLAHIALAATELQATGRIAGERTILRKDGQLREVEVRAARTRPGIYCAMLHDITARKVAERSLQQLSGRLLQLQDEERRRIARALHETTAQNLAAMRLNLSRINRWSGYMDQEVQDAVDEMKELTDQSISEIRTLSYLLHPPLIDEAGLLPSLRWLTRGFQERSGINVSLEVPDDLRRMPVEIETAVFRIVQEALTNVQRHSGSEAATIRLEDDQSAIRVSVQDQGLGLPSELRADQGALTAAGVGIAGMRERVRELGGTLRIVSDENGTIIEVMLPTTTEAPLATSEHTHR